MNKFLEIIWRYFINPVKYGFIGFTLFFTTLLFSKLFTHAIGIYDHFLVDVKDVILSSLGFIFLFLIGLISAFKKNKVELF